MTIQYGLASAEDLQSLGGLELLRRMIDGRIPGPTIARTLGFRLAEVGDGLAVFEMEAGPHLLNPLGSVHGGVALTLIDSAAGCALHSALPAGTSYTTVETKVNFSRPISPDAGKVRCEGTLLTHGRQIATAEARLLSANGKILAHGTSTLMILAARG